MKKVIVFTLILSLSISSLYSQEFDGTYKVTYVGVEGDGVGQMSPIKVKWYAVVKGDTVIIYDSKKLNTIIGDPIPIGTSTNGDYRVRTILNKPSEEGGEFSLVSTSVDDFTKRVSNMVYLLKKE